MSDEEDVQSGGDEAPRKPAEIKTGGLNEEDQLLLRENKEMRSGLADEIGELREQSKQRKKEREDYEQQMAERRNDEEARRKTEEEQRKQRREEEEIKRHGARAHQMVNQFIPIEETQSVKMIIQKSAGGGGGGGGADEEESGGGEKKSKEQLENEKRAILAQRIPAFDISGYDSGKLKEKCKELHGLIFRNESEKYDLEKRFKEQQYDMMELAERARQMNKVGKGGLKRVQMGPDEIDPLQSQIPSAPSKVEMFSKYERQKDKRSYGEKRDCYTGPSHKGAADKVDCCRIVKWGEEGLPTYEAIPGMGGEEEVAEE